MEMVPAHQPGVHSELSRSGGAAGEVKMPASAGLCHAVGTEALRAGGGRTPLF